MCSEKNSICSAFSDSGGAWPPAGWRFFFFFFFPSRFSFYFLPIENQRFFFFFFFTVWEPKYFFQDKAKRNYFFLNSIYARNVFVQIYTIVYFLNPIYMGIIYMGILFICSYWARGCRYILKLFFLFQLSSDSLSWWCSSFYIVILTFFFLFYYFFFFINCRENMWMRGIP